MALDVGKSDSEASLNVKAKSYGFPEQKQKQHTWRGSH